MAIFSISFFKKIYFLPYFFVSIVYMGGKASPNARPVIFMYQVFPLDVPNFLLRPTEKFKQIIAPLCLISMKIPVPDNIRSGFTYYLESFICFFKFFLCFYFISNIIHYHQPCLY